MFEESGTLSAVLSGESSLSVELFGRGESARLFRHGNGMDLGLGKRVPFSGGIVVRLELVDSVAHRGLSAGCRPHVSP